MQISDIGSGVFASLSSRLELVKAEVSKNGRFEERTYKKFGLKIRRRRFIPEQIEQEPGELTESSLVSAEHERQEDSLSDSGLTNLALSIQAEVGSPNGGVPSVAKTSHVEPLQAEPSPPPLPASTRVAEPEEQSLSSQIHAILSGKTLGVVGFSPQDGAAIGQALAAQYCSFVFLSHADAEFRKGSTNGCDLLVISVPPEWSRPGSLSPASLLKTKKPILMIGEREVLSALALRSQAGLLELVPVPWNVDDMIWRAATLLGRVQEPRGKERKEEPTQAHRHRR